MQRRGTTIASMCRKQETCRSCIFNDGKCIDFLNTLHACESPDEYYNAFTHLYGEPECEANECGIIIKYHEGAVPLEKIAGGDWVDLSAAESVRLVAGESYCISLGVSMKLPEGYEALIVPRSSLFAKKGLIQTNSMGVIDNSFCGDNDVWKLPVYATRECYVSAGERICQFRIIKNQPACYFHEVKVMGETDRGGLGSTGGYNES